MDADFAHFISGCSGFCKQIHVLLSSHVVAQVAELNAKVEELEKQFNAATEDKEAAIKESERCQLKLQLANRLINALASEGE